MKLLLLSIIALASFPLLQGSHVRGSREAQECNFELNNAEQSWEVHHQFALGQGCDMASISNEVEFQMVVAFLQESAVGRGTTVFTGGMLIGEPGRPGPESWAWSDSSVFSYEKWWENEPNDSGNLLEDRIGLRWNARLFNDVAASSNFPALYKCCGSDSRFEDLISSDYPSMIPSDIPSIAPSDFPSTMPSDIPSISPSVPATISDYPSLVPVAYENEQETASVGLCGFLLAKRSLPWESHKLFAGQLGCSLASITSEEEYDKISSLIADNVDEFSSVILLWIGGQARDGGTLGEPGAENWEWIDGSIWNYENWYEGEPNNYIGTETGLSLLNIGGVRKFNDEDKAAEHPALYKCCRR